MAGFLDNKERVIDMVLTGVGKDLLLKGDLHFVYWTPFDDEIDYDPFISNRSALSPEAAELSRTTNIEDTCVREACSGYRDLNSSQEDRTNLNRPMFTIPANQSVIPEMKLEGPVSGGIVVTTRQQKTEKYYVRQDASGTDIVDRIGPVETSIKRFGSERSTIDADYALGSYPREFDLEGFLVTIYHSSSEGYQEVLPNRDSSGSIVYSNDMKIGTPIR